MYRVKASVSGVFVLSKGLLTAQQAIEMYKIYEQGNQNPEILDENGRAVSLEDLKHN